DETDGKTIKNQKYRKGVSIEASGEKGYEAAVAMTDEEFTADLQNVVMTKFYDMLKMGSLTSHETSWQMAFAMAIGRVKNKFETMGRIATGIDRKSTRLNSSHVSISYAVFCLKKKKKINLTKKMHPPYK